MAQERDGQVRSLSPLPVVFPHLKLLPQITLISWFFLFIYFDSYKHDVVVDIPKPRHMSNGLRGGRFGPDAADGQVGDEGGGAIVVFQGQV